MAKVRINGKLICSYLGHSKGETAILDRTLEIYQLPSGTLKGVLWCSSRKGWAENENNIISKALFKEKDRDNTEYRVVEYFGGKSAYCYRKDAETSTLKDLNK